VILAKFGVVPPNLTGPVWARSTERSPFVHRLPTLAAVSQPTAAALLGQGLGVVL